MVHNSTLHYDKVLRYIALCKHQLYPQIFTWRNTTLLCVAIWVASILIDIPTTLGWGSNGYDEKAMICLYDRTYEYSYTLFFAITSVFIPIGIVFICYLKIFLFVRAKKKELRLAENAGTTPTTARNSKAQRDEIRLARTLFIIFIAFFICWGSYAFLVVFDIYDKAPKIWHAISIELAHATSSGVNFILYGATNAQFRNAYKQILCPRRAQVAPSSMVTHTEGITMQKARFSNYRAATGETIKQVETIT
ncbi:PREDICTED: tyramine receptor Ser-2-like [Priapulus caudatus]|uniref:Tyramine receptor Ser-2-like n=1 Tax=Priapulus caudatus TaxID=37621 RepID=A0ABM1F9H2_PRICU|nr:PREDICTED: tyramine receptor Ser-2-like [Priapulus caudatus]